uniref:Uncharacterized protein n=1 Tax=Oryza glumipatula TaxID=40148 RepID=A0A0E0AAF5_9ORYZ
MKEKPRAKEIKTDTTFITPHIISKPKRNQELGRSRYTQRAMSCRTNPSATAGSWRLWKRRSGHMHRRRP